MKTERFLVRGDLGFAARQRCIAAARAAMDSTDESVALDCSGVDVAEAIDDPVIGMPVTLGRAARRQGAKVALVGAPRRMRLQFEAAGVAHFFNWDP